MDVPSPLQNNVDLYWISKRNMSQVCQNYFCIKYCFTSTSFKGYRILILSYRPETHYTMHKALDVPRTFGRDCWRQWKIICRVFTIAYAVEFFKNSFQTSNVFKHRIRSAVEPFGRLNYDALNSYQIGQVRN